LDDFGTGYSSFSYLANLPIYGLKIDRSFLLGIHNHNGRFSVLQAIVDLAHKLGIMVVAEGIEDADQLKAVRDSGCDEVQGFLFAKPGLPERIRRMRTPVTRSLNLACSQPNLYLPASSHEAAVGNI
jgi:EAL domain-containing protein (putative c-di-GMP-specific phosphodiesterase class I)